MYLGDHTHIQLTDIAGEVLDHYMYYSEGRPMVVTKVFKRCTEL